MLRSIFVFALIASVFGDNPAPAYQPAPAPAYQPAPAPAYQPAPYDESPKPYNYQYAVNDDYSGINFSAQENSDAKVISGSYTVALPDGRIQTVSYTVDGYSGYVADVQYEGTPTYPKYEPKPAYKPAPASAYKPAPQPSYKPAPSYKA